MGDTRSVTHCKGWGRPRTGSQRAGRWKARVFLRGCLGKASLRGGGFGVRLTLIAREEQARYPDPFIRSGASARPGRSGAVNARARILFWSGGPESVRAAFPTPSRRCRTGGSNTRSRKAGKSSFYSAWGLPLGIGQSFNERLVVNPFSVRMGIRFNFLRSDRCSCVDGPPELRRPVTSRQANLIPVRRTGRKQLTDGAQAFTAAPCRARLPAQTCNISVTRAPLRVLTPRRKLQGEVMRRRFAP
jgi:hypothetical protein